MLVFYIVGDGMVPVIKDGDEMHVQYTDTLVRRAIRVFTIDGKPLIC